MLGPVDVVEAGDADAVGGGGMGEELVFEVDADVGDFALAVGEEEDVAFADL